MSFVPASCVDLFRKAGWFPGRLVKLQNSCTDCDAASKWGIRLLEECGGLRVGRCGPGRDCATSDIAFAMATAQSDRDNIREWEVVIGERLFPVGLAHNSHVELFVDANGRLFAYGVPDRSLTRYGESLSDAIERLLLGHAPSAPLLRLPT